MIELEKYSTNIKISPPYFKIELTEFSVKVEKQVVSWIQHKYHVKRIQNQFHEKNCFITHLHIIMDFESVVKIEQIFHFVVRDAAIDDSLFTRIHNNKWQLNSWIWSWLAFTFFPFLIPFHQIFESDLLKLETKILVK